MSSVCVPAQKICPNMLRGFCMGGDCKDYSHDIRDPRMGSAAFNLMNKQCLWVHLGKYSNFSYRLEEKIRKYIGEIKRIDFVPMKGDIDKGGAYWCAVIHFSSIGQKAVDLLRFGKAIFVKNRKNFVRFTLLRAEVKEKKDLEERQLVAEAAIQARNALFAAKKAALKTELIACMHSHVTEEDVWNGALDW